MDLGYSLNRSSKSPILYDLHRGLYADHGTAVAVILISLDVQMRLLFNLGSLLNANTQTLF